MRFKPTSVISCSANSALIDSKLNRQSSIPNVRVFSYKYYLIKIKLCPSVAFPKMGTEFISSLYAHVFRVVWYRSEPKVGWINTPPVIAVWTIVKNAKAFWNWTEVKNPTGSVGIFPAQSMESFMDISVSRFSYRSNPNPTRLSKVDFRKEPLWKCFRKSLLQQIFRCRSELLNIIHSNLGHALGGFRLARAFSL